MNRYLYIVSLLLPLCMLTSCFKDDEVEDYTEWKAENEKYVAEAAQMRDDSGELVYQRLIPSWASTTYTLIKWHNPADAAQSAFIPLDNSTVDIKYETLDINDNVIDSSYNMVQYGDSIYRTTPGTMITGVRAALEVMHPGDSVSLVVPSSAAYGIYTHGKVKPYSTLKFNLKLVGIHRFEIP